MAHFDLESSFGTSRFSSSTRWRESSFAMLARSMAISFAFGSFGFCAVVRNKTCLVRPGELTYYYPRQKCFQECIIVGERLQNLLVRRDVDQNGKAILSDRRIVLDDEFEVLDRL